MPNPTCPDCGKELKVQTPAGLCPNCLLQLGQRAVPCEDAAAPQPDARAISPNSIQFPTEKSGDRIGRYKLLQEIGEGGMGTVWMAEQEEPVRRRVALKIVKLGMDTKQVIGRFEAERQALALMDHPNIAKILDAGATDTGRPFFVMELVKGITITKYCDSNKLDPRRRLRIFVEVCMAIQHAHQKGIIHRDLKPSNVLVTEQDGRAVPKVIDFGIAKATELELTERTFYTRFNQLVGTPAYMSPEQAGLGSLDIDTRSDVYSLGVLLYELLTGRTPFSGEELLKAGLDQVLRTIREKEPAKPSTRLSTLAQDDLLETAKRRASEPRKLNRLVRGDLDWIVMKSLEKERTRRYETANGLARDIERHLNNEPVVARPPSAAYRFRKAIRRNQLAFSAAAAIATVLVTGIVGSAWQAIRATRAEREQARLRQEAERERQRAKLEASRSAEVARFLTDMLKAAGPRVARGRDATLLREMLEVTARRISKELGEQSEVRGDLFMAIGQTYGEIGDNPHAASHFEQAAQSYRQAFGDSHAKLAIALGNLGSAQSFLGKISEGSTNAGLGLTMARRLGDDPTLATCLLLYAGALNHLGQATPVAVPYLREALAIQRRLGTDSESLLLCLRRLSMSVLDTREGEDLARESLVLSRKLSGEESPSTASTRFSLGQQLLNTFKYSEAEVELRKAFELWQKLFDRDHPYRAIVLRFLVQSFALQSKWADGEAAVRQEMAVLPTNTYCRSLLAALEVSRGQWSAATTLFRPTLATLPDRREAEFDWLVILAESGEHQQHRDRSREFLKQVGSERNKFHAEWAAKTALLLPAEAADLKLATELADFAADEPGPGDFSVWAWMTKALAEYRNGRFDSASEWATRAITAQRIPAECKAPALFIKALALARSQQIESARTALNEGTLLLRRYRAGIILQHWTLENHWPVRDWLFAEVLRREAQSLLAGPAAPAK